MASLVAQFNMSLRTGVAPLYVNFTNTSTGPFVSVRWEFGDGAQSSEINPSHQYASDGTYQVKLKVFDTYSGSSEAVGVVTVFPADDYSTSSTTQQALFTSKRFNTGEVAVRKTLVDGSTVETLYPVSAATGQLNGTVDLSKIGLFTVTGATPTTVSYNTTLYPSLGTAYAGGATCYLGVFAKTGTTPTLDCGGRQLHIYRATNIAAGVITVDRPMRDFSASTAGVASFYLTSSGATYSGNSSLKSLQGAPAIDTLEYLDHLELYQPTSRASGTLSYFVADSGNGLTRLFIQPSFSGWNTVEKWKVGSVRLTLPYVMWHTKATSGVSLVDSTETNRDLETDLEYSNLTIENVGTIVGKVYHSMKLISIEDSELQAALTYISNRNWTLPAPVVTTTSTVDGTGGLQTGVTYFVTYALADTLAYTNTNTQFGNRNSYPLHCRYIQTLTPTIAGNKLRIQAPQSSWYVTSRTTSSDTGFTAGVAVAIIGSATTSNIGDVTSWHVATLTSPATLFAGEEVPYTSGAKTSPTTIPFSSGSSTLNFGVDPIVIGHFSATSQSSIYKMSATCVAKNTEFNNTQNTTFDETLNESVYITEVALYNENNELLMTGKLNTPIEKNDKQFVTIKMELDL